MVVSWERLREIAVQTALPVVAERDDAQDVAQKTLMAILQKYSALTASDKELEALCRRIATNHALDQLRAEASRRTEMLDPDDGDTSDALLGDKGLSLEDPADIISADQQKAAMQRKVGELSHRYATAWALWSDGFSYEVIAKHLHTTKANARQIVSRACTYIREESTT